MQRQAGTDQSGHLVDPSAVPMLDVLGPTIRYLTPPDGDDRQPCVMEGRVPGGVVVPLHSHPDPETFVVMSGRLDGLRISDRGYEWVPIGAGDIFHIPGDARHAWRNPCQEPAVTIIVSTVKIARFFGEVGSPVDPTGASAWPPPAPAAERLLATAERYGYWNATADENAALGLRLG
jgi:mannose-6-phosphate isomerase-like protein (cupin superfamily)